MKIKGILFDKDGTLIDFFGLWLDAAKQVIPAFIRQNQLEQYEGLDKALYEAIGIYEKWLDPNGAFAYKSYGEIAADMEQALKTYDIHLESGKITEEMKHLFTKATQSRDARIVPLTELTELFEELKSRELYIGVATADTEKAAVSCMKKLGVLEYLDYLGSDDGTHKAKPHPEMLLDFAEQSNIHPQEVLVAGDTKNDMIFAKRAGAKAAGVLSGVSRKEDLEPYAQYIIPSVEELPALLDTLENEKKT